MSNFFPQPFEFLNIVFPSSEHAFQAFKTLNKNEFLQITQAASPAEAKKLGKQVTLRPDWEQPVMRKILRAKFSNPQLKAKLLGTKGCLLVEGNNWGDSSWSFEEN